VDAKLPTSLAQKKCLTDSHFSDPAELSNSLLSPQSYSVVPASLWWGASIHRRSPETGRNPASLQDAVISLSHQTTPLCKTGSVRFTRLCTV